MAFSAAVYGRGGRSGRGRRSRPRARAPGRGAAGLGIRMAGHLEVVCGQTIMKLAGELGARARILSSSGRPARIVGDHEARCSPPSSRGRRPTCSTGMSPGPCGSVDDVRASSPTSARVVETTISSTGGSSWRSVILDCVHRSARRRSRRRRSALQQPGERPVEPRRAAGARVVVDDVTLGGAFSPGRRPRRGAAPPRAALERVRQRLPGTVSFRSRARAHRPVSGR